jgi:hypothetical protein
LSDFHNPNGVAYRLLPVISHADGVAYESVIGVTTGGVHRLRVGNPVGVRSQRVLHL